jgi:hypothetical protein
MALALFYSDGYEEVMRKLADGLEYMGTWRREWKMPTPGGLCQARQRLSLKSAWRIAALRVCHAGAMAVRALVEPCHHGAIWKAGPWSAALVEDAVGLTG